MENIPHHVCVFNAGAQKWDKEAQHVKSLRRTGNSFI